MSDLEFTGSHLAGVACKFTGPYGHCSGAINAQATFSFPAPSCPVDMNGPDLVVTINGSQRGFAVVETPQEVLFEVVVYRNPLVKALSVRAGVCGCLLSP